MPMPDVLFRRIRYISWALNFIPNDPKTLEKIQFNDRTRLS